MAQEEEEDTVSSRVQQQLLSTPYACSLLSRLPTRPANFVYRGILTRSVHNGNDTASSIIIKLSDADQSFDGALLDSIATSPTFNTSTTATKTPRLYYYNTETRIQILEDFINTDGLHKFVSAGPDSFLQGEIGLHLGSWLRSFHTWSSSPEQAPIRTEMWRNDSKRILKYSYTYDSFLRVLRNYPDILQGCEQTLECVRNSMAAEVEKPSTEETAHWGLIHGDFWSGK